MSILNQKYTNFNDFVYLTELTAQIKSLEGYSDELPVALIGQIFNDKTNTAGSLIGNRFTIGGKSESNASAYTMQWFWREYIGFTPDYVEGKELEEIAQKQETVNMPCYPKDGSIKIIDGTVIVKINEELKNY